MDRVPPGDGPLVGVYKATIDDGAKVRHAKLSLWADPPDRLHAELYGPVGGVIVVLDAGPGKVCVVDVNAATAYTGDDGAAAIEALVGVRVGTAEAVAALLAGTSPPGWTVEREGPAGSTLPDRLRIAQGARSVALSRQRFERGSADSRALGTGEPPPRMAVEPLSALAPAPAAGS